MMGEFGGVVRVQRGVNTVRRAWYAEDTRWFRRALWVVRRVRIVARGRKENGEEHVSGDSRRVPQDSTHALRASREEDMVAVWCWCWVLTLDEVILYAKR
jgi:hypothetical protein